MAAVLNRFCIKGQRGHVDRVHWTRLRKRLRQRVNK